MVTFYFLALPVPPPEASRDGCILVIVRTNYQNTNMRILLRERDPIATPRHHLVTEASMTCVFPLPGGKESRLPGAVSVPLMSSRLLPPCSALHPVHECPRLLSVYLGLHAIQIQLRLPPLPPRRPMRRKPPGRKPEETTPQAEGRVDSSSSAPW